MKKISIIFVASLMASSLLAHSAKMQNLQFFWDASGQQSKAQLLEHADWQPLDGDKPHNLGYSDGRLWLRWQMENHQAAARPQVLMLNFELLQDVRLYSRSVSEATSRSKAWHAWPKMRALRKSGFAIEEAPGQSEYLLQLRSDGPFIIDVDILSPQAWQKQRGKERTVQGFLFLFIVSLGFYNLLLFVLHRRKIYANYIVLMVFFCSFLFVRQGGLALLWPDQRFDLMRMISTLALFIIVSLTVFTRSFLYTEQLQARLDKWLRWSLLGSLAQIALIALCYEYWFATLVSVWLISVAVLLLIVGVDSWRRGFIPARLFSLSWLLVLVAVFMSLFKVMGLLAVSSMTLRGFHIGFALEALTLSLAMQDRLVHDKRKLDRINLQLEDKVLSRSKALSIAAQKMRTQDKEMEQEIAERKELQEQLFHSQKMESLGRLAGGIARDMNNVLGAILGFAALLRQDSEDDSPEVQDLDDILTAARRGRDLTGKLLGFARKGVFRKEALDVQQLLREEADFLRRGFEKNIEINLHFSESLPPCLGDPEQLALAFVNLCTNAAEAMPKGGAIDISTELIHSGDADAPEKSDKGSWIRVRIKDQGAGLSQEDQARAFEPFYSTKRGQGSGMGLAMVYGVAESHGGYAQLNCELGHGCEAIFVIRAAPELLDESGSSVILAKSPAQASAAQQELYVLLADDERAMRNVGQRMLESLGCQVVLAQDGEEAVRIFRREPQRFDLIMLDVRMPKLDGVEAYLQMRANRADICSLVTSGFSQDARLSEMVQDPCCVFLAKPFDLNMLQKALAKLPLKKNNINDSSAAETS